MSKLYAFVGYKYDEKKKEYKKSMKDFDSNILDVVLLKLKEKELVQDKNILRSKHIGHSIMVSTFLYSYYGLLQLSDEQLQVNPHIEQKEAFILRSVQTDRNWNIC
ncbi:hypothetical protein RhiirB3_440236 [Rhizophagus irregularis]|nr:hypothetical protein RhiirB3_440236 [Rhizophagus irregularis]